MPTLAFGQCARRFLIVFTKKENIRIGHTMQSAPLGELAQWHSFSLRCTILLSFFFLVGRNRGFRHGVVHSTICIDIMIPPIIICIIAVCKSGPSKESSSIYILTSPFSIGFSAVFLVWLCQIYKPSANLRGDSP